MNMIDINIIPFKYIYIEARFSFVIHKNKESMLFHSVKELTHPLWFPWTNIYIGQLWHMLGETGWTGTGPHPPGLVEPLQGGRHRDRSRHNSGPSTSNHKGVVSLLHHNLNHTLIWQFYSVNINHYKYWMVTVSGANFGQGAFLKGIITVAEWEETHILLTVKGLIHSNMQLLNPKI